MSHSSLHEWVFHHISKKYGRGYDLGTATGLSTTVRGKEGHAPKIIMAVNYCGRQQAQRLGWAAPANDKKEGATLQPREGKHSLQHDGRFEVQVGTWNFGGLSEKLREVCKELRKRMIDVFCA